ncbi:MAG: glycosyltransferase family 2 protein [Chitinophagales bacterium]|nr:glycosyltransferase family 2 protein [Chitinophagales bacterium]MDW8427656.1 glycosyltransferase family 2 protein [Chitinophagales bacterium]
MEWLGWSGLAFAVVRGIISLLNLLWPPQLRPTNPRHSSVSVLIPARNEAHRVGLLLEALQQSQLEYRDAWVLDDHSTDLTAEVVRRYAVQNPKLKLIQGEPLPPGWLGKTWACHQLGQKAEGDYLLFLDADVRLQPGAISAMVLALQQSKSHLLSVFPRQEMNSWGERIAVPIMFEILLGLLPLFLVRRTRMWQVAAANGQCLLFSAEVYKQNWWHKLHRQSLAEDITIARSMKKMGYHVSVLLSPQISCRMYARYREALSGFAKNIVAMTGNGFFLALYCLLVVFSLPGAAWLPMSAALLWLASEVFIVVIHSYLAGMRTAEQLLLLPLRRLSLVAVAGLAFWKHFFSTHQWKGRSIA